jgi:trigger factor
VNVAVERLPESQVLLDISTDEQEFEKALQRAYRKVVNQVRLPGFRPGKAPRMIIERMLGREVLIEQADRDLLDPLYQEALKQEDINPVGEPEVEIYQTEPLAFKVTVQVYPTIDLGDYQSVRVEPKPVAITDEQVEETITRLQQNQSPWEEPAEARPVQEGDRVTVDVAVREAGGEEPYREPLVDSVYVLGRDNLFEQLHDALIGMNVGDEQTVEIPFAEDNEGVEAGMRGKTMAYTLTLKKIEEQHLLPIDDEFAQKVTDGKQETLEALRADIRKELLRSERQKARNEVGTEAIAALGELATLEIPAVMIDKQVDTDIENQRNHLAQEHNETLEAHLRHEGKTVEELREEIRPEATRRLRNSLVLREIATREGISVNAQDIDAEIDRMIGGMENGEQMRQFYSSNYIRNMLESEVFERKLLDRVIAIATEGRGPADPPEEPEEAAEVAGSEAGEDSEPGVIEASYSVAEDSVAEDDTTDTTTQAAETAGVLPEDRSVPIGEAEAVAASETVLPEAGADEGEHPEE